MLQYDRRAMQIETFLMERFQSIWEHHVRYNLSESGVHPLKIGDLIEPGALQELALGYPQTNGSLALRERISALYPGADADNVVATNGTAEGHFITAWNLLSPGDDFAMMLPNYMQLWGVATALGANPQGFHLVQQHDRWALDVAQLEAAVTARTRLIAICNPNNPTGATLTEAEMDAIVRVAERTGAWILSDEVYQGAELSDAMTPSFWGRYDKLLVGCGFSKACGLPGLRVGWIVGPKERVAQLWAHKDYTTITPSMLSDRLATIALEPSMRTRILERTRSIIRSQFPILDVWARAQGGLFNYLPPRAGAIAYLRYNLPVNSTELIERLRDEKSVLVVPGDHFGMDGYVRIGVGGEKGVLENGLALFGELLDTLRVPIHGAHLSDRLAPARFN
jgi:aspartate/methionine/tyrosine aminotransferase